MYTVTLYNNTGFDMVNVPGSPAVLQAAAASVTELPAVDIVQNYFINTVSVKATFEQVKMADYCKIGDFYYFVNSLSMSSPDVAVLSLTPDGLTSGLASGAITAISGTTERRRVKSDEDTMGAFTADDPLLAPQEPLQLVIGNNLFTAGGSTTTVPFVESLIDLGKLQEQSTTGKFTGRTFTDPTDEDAKVTVPAVDSLSGQTTVFSIGSKILPSTKTNLYRYTKVQEALGLARALGVESGVISQTSLPPALVDTTETADGSVTTCKGKVQSVSTALPYQYATVKNKRLLYGQYNSYGILTVAGNKLECMPEELSDSFTGSPSVTVKADPRPTGKPYFRYSQYHGDSSDEGFWLNAVAGLQWAQVPLVYTGKSNSVMDTYNYQALRRDANAAYTNNWKNWGFDMVNNLTNFLGSVMGASNGLSSGKAADISSAKQGLVTSGVSYLSNYFRSNMNWNYYKEQFRNAQRDELVNYGFSQSVIVPTINFAYNGDAIRDTLGNGAISYRYRYSDNDITRIDKLLTMYGYVDRRAFEPSMMNAHSDFDYLQLTGVSVSGATLPMWWRDLIKTQLNTGLRIWHVKPDVKYYE